MRSDQREGEGLKIMEDEELKRATMGEEESRGLKAMEDRR